MSTFLTILHVLAAIVLIVVILLQAGKGAEVGAVLGGAGSQTIFGGAGSGGFLAKVTWAGIVVFMVTALALTAIGRNERLESLVDQLPPPSAAEAPAAGTAPTTTPTAAAAATAAETATTPASKGAER